MTTNLLLKSLYLILVLLSFLVKHLGCFFLLFLPKELHLFHLLFHLCLQIHTLSLQQFAMCKLPVCFVRTIIPGGRPILAAIFLLDSIILLPLLGPPGLLRVVEPTQFVLFIVRSATFELFYCSSDQFRPVAIS